MAIQDLPGGPVVGTTPANAGDTGLIPGPGGSHIPQSNSAHEPSVHHNKEWPLPLSAARENPYTAPKTQHSQKQNKYKFKRMAI